MEDFAKLDNRLAASQLSIGESSNLAQLAQTYDCTFGDQKYKDYVCILSVLAQIAIDSAKRLFDVDVSDEIRRIKKDMDVKHNKYPDFWKIIRRDFKEQNINHSLICPMNYLYDLKLDQFRSSLPTLPMSNFFVKYDLEKNRKTCKKIEELIELYSIDLSRHHYALTYEDGKDDFWLIRSDFDSLITDMSKIYVSSTYLGLFSWLLDRAFCITPVSYTHLYGL